MPNVLELAIEGRHVIKILKVHLLYFLKDLRYREGLGQEAVLTENVSVGI